MAVVYLNTKTGAVVNDGSEPEEGIVVVAVNEDITTAERQARTDRATGNYERRQRELQGI